MSRLELKPDYRNPGRIALRVFTAWDDTGAVLLRLPEAMSHGGGHVFCEWDRKRPWPDAEPLALPEWRWTDDGVSLGYRCQTARGVTMYAQATPGRDLVDMVLGIRNDSPQPLHQISANVCAILSDCPEFCDRTLARTYFLHAGKPRTFGATSPAPPTMARPPWIHCQVRGVPPLDPGADCPWWVCRERADDGLIFTQSSSGSRFVALIWGRATSILANSTTPCIHSNPKLDECPPGASVEQRGRLLLHEGKMDLLCVRALDGMA